MYGENGVAREHQKTPIRRHIRRLRSTFYSPQLTVVSRERPDKPGAPRARIHNIQIVPTQNGQLPLCVRAARKNTGSYEVDVRGILRDLHDTQDIRRRVMQLRFAGRETHHPFTATTIKIVLVDIFGDALGPRVA